LAGLGDALMQIERDQERIISQFQEDLEIIRIRLTKNKENVVLMRGVFRHFASFTTNKGR